jgi:phosphate uptake regulator
MTRRKIIKQANQAHTITLPIEWIRENNLDKKNSEVDVIPSEKSLIITNKGNVEIKKASLDLKDKKETRALGALISALYAKGTDEITLNSEKDISKDIIESLNENLGFALVSKEGKKYVIKDVGGGNYSNLDEIFKRVFQMLLIFYNSAIEDVFGEEKETIDSLHHRDREINKFCLFLERAVNKMSYSNAIESRIIFAYAIELERIGDEIHRLWRTNILNKIKKTKEMRNIVDLSKEALEKSFELYFNIDKDGQEKIYQLKEKTREAMLKLKRQDAIVSRFLGYALKIAEDSADLSHLTMMKNL